ncbi:methyltransferase [Amycolatopsis sp. NPDC054798]
MTTAKTKISPGLMHLRETALAGARAAAVRAAARLGVADALDDRPATVAELAAATGTRPGELRRLLRALAAHDIFAEEADGRYRHTDASWHLREDAESSIKYVVLWSTEPWTWRLWPQLDEAVRTGENVFAALHDRSFFEHLRAEEPESGRILDRAMVQASSLSVDSIVATLDLAGVSSIADIGGGRGQVLSAVLARHPELRGTLFDHPAALANADERLRENGDFGSRATLLAGDCRQAVPVRADAYLAKSILDWDDESGVTTLRNIAAAARPGAKVFVVENLIGSAQLGFATAMDLLLLLNVGGRKRTEAELTALIEQAGLVVGDVRPIDSYLHLFDCRVP